MRKLLFAASLILAAPAVSSDADVATYRALAAQDLRLASVGYRLASANARFCARKSFNPGWVIHDIRQYPDEATARAAFAFRQPVEISGIVASGPAASQGLKPEDAIMAVGDRDVAEIGEAKGGYARLEQFKQLLAADLQQDGRAKLTIMRSGRRFDLLFRPQTVCASEYWVDTRAKLDAGADGQKVRITSGMMEYVQDDAELAAVVAHELSHNLLGHRADLASVKRGKLKAVLATEIEADRLSVWLMANAGYDPKAALSFWERYGRKTGLGIFSDGTHLSWKNRVKVMQSEIDAMSQSKRKDGLLWPPLLAGGGMVTP